MIFRIAKIIRRAIASALRLVANPAAVCSAKHPRVICGKIFTATLPAAAVFAAAALIAHNADAQVNPENKCRGGGHTWISNTCVLTGAQHVDADDQSSSAACQVGNSPLTNINCVDVFGPNFDFPTSPGDYYYNCDTDGSRGLIPATFNAIQATDCHCADSLKTAVGVRAAGGFNHYKDASCQCVDPYEDDENGPSCLLQCPHPKVATSDQLECVCPPDFVDTADGGCLLQCEFPKLENIDKSGCTCPQNYIEHRGTCVPNSEESQRICEDEGWTWNPGLDGFCTAPLGVTFYNAQTGSTNICWFAHKGDRTLCSDIFGPRYDFPTENGVYHYNCDPTGTRGLIPATVNTTGATDCRCENPEEALIGAGPHPSLDGLTDYTGANCVCSNRKVPNADNTECVCPQGHLPLGDNCIPEDKNFGENYNDNAFQQYLCRAFGGNAPDPIFASRSPVCSGMDMHGTFCIVGSVGAFPCRGLFKHLRECNLTHNRPALNMFLCGAKCAEGETAIGAECR